MVVVAESLILLTGSFDLSLQSIYGLAPMIGAWLIVPKDGQGLGTDWNPVVGILVVLGDRRGGRALQRLHDREAPLQRLHLHAGDADPARRAAAGDRQRADDLRACRRRSSTSAPRTGSASRSRPGSRSRVFLVAGLFLRYHRTGRAIYAIGGNLEAARAAGIKVDRIRIGVFSVAGMLAAVAGLMIAGQVVAVTANQGNNLIFTVFAAAVIGGIALEGGRGRMVGAFTGVVLLGLVNNVLVLRNTSTFWIDAANGAIILIALGLARAVTLVRA